MEHLIECKKIIRKSEYSLEEERTIIRNFGSRKLSPRQQIHHYQLRWDRKPLNQYRWAIFWVQKYQERSTADLYHYSSAYSPNRRSSYLHEITFASEHSSGNQRWSVVRQADKKDSLIYFQYLLFVFLSSSKYNQATIRIPQSKNAFF